MDVGTLLNKLSDLGTLLASIAALATARATFSSVAEMRQQRRIESAPELQVIVFSRPILGYQTRISGTLLAWPWRRSHAENEFYRIEIVNLGRGSAVNVKANWHYDAGAFLNEATALAHELGIIDRFTFDHNRVEIRFPNEDYWSFHYVDFGSRSIGERKSIELYFDHILPKSMGDKPVEIDFSHHVQQLVALLIRLYHHLPKRSSPSRQLAIDRLNAFLATQRITLSLEYGDSMGNLYSLDTSMRLNVRLMTASLDENMEEKLEPNSQVFLADLVPFEGERNETTAYES